MIHSLIVFLGIYGAGAGIPLGLASAFFADQSPRKAFVSVQFFTLWTLVMGGLFFLPTMPLLGVGLLALTPVVLTHITILVERVKTASRYL